MSEGLVLHLTECKNSSMVASVKVAQFIAMKTGYPLIDKPDMVPVKAYKNIIQVNSPTGFAPSDWRWQAAELAVLAENWVFAQQDYKLAPQSQVKRMFERYEKSYEPPIMWTTVPARMKGHPKDSYVNFNQLTWRPQPRKGPENKGLFYYGALRLGREQYFAKYLSGNDYPVTLSAPKRGWKKFAEYCPKAVMIEPMEDVIIGMQDYPATMYIEDRTSHKMYCSPANRFYEALSAGIAIFVDSSASKTLDTASLPNVQKYVVDGPTDVIRLLENSTLIALEQRVQWTGNYISRLEAQLAEAIGKL